LNSSPLLPPLLSSTHGPSPRPWSRARHRRGGAWRLAIGVLMGKEWERAGERGKELIGFARRRSPKVRERETETRSKQTKEPAVPGRSLRGAAMVNLIVVLLVVLRVENRESRGEEQREVAVLSFLAGVEKEKEERRSVSSSRTLEVEVAEEEGSNFFVFRFRRGCFPLRFFSFSPTSVREQSLGLQELSIPFARIDGLGLKSSTCPAARIAQRETASVCGTARRIHHRVFCSSPRRSTNQRRRPPPPPR